MKKLLSLAMACLAGSVLAQAEKMIVDFGAAGFEPTRSIHTDGLTYEIVPGGAIKVNVRPHGGWPGFYVSFPGEFRNLSDFGGVSIEAHNPGDAEQWLGIRVDNHGADGSKYCNVQNYTVGPGETKTLAVWFGFNNNNPGFQLDTANVTGICLFWHQPKNDASLIVRDIKAIPPRPDLAAITPRERLVIDFEADDHLFTLHGGTLVEGADAIAGKRSLAGQRLADSPEWFEFFATRPGLLAGNFTYTVKFQYRVVDADANAKFFSFFRSHSRGWGKWDRAWVTIGDLAAKKGQTLTQEHTVDLPRFRDYMFQLGITGGQAKVVIDNIEITRGAPYNDGDLLERAVAKRNANAEVVHFVDFEDGLPGHTTILGEITDNAAEVLMGKKSLVADTIGRGQEWNIILTTGRGKIEPGYKYFVTIPVRMEKKGARGSVYVYATPLREGDKNLGWRNWNSGVGDDDVISTTFSFRDGPGYQLHVGIQNEARIIVDEIEIRREKLPPDLVPSLVLRDPKNMTLVFEDTFDGPEIDETKWNISGDGPQRGAIMRKANSVIEDGKYVMLFTPDGDTFGTAAINTQGKHEFKFGYFEARMKMPKYEGHWPGFWLFNGAVNAVTGDGREGTEIDIMEAPWRHEDKITHALHWDGYGDDHAVDGITVDVPGLHEGFHTFAVDWQEHGYIFLVNGVETWRTDAGGVCQNPLWIIVSDELGGWSGNARKVDKALFPDRIEVDYVRVWQ